MTTDTAQTVEASIKRTDELSRIAYAELLVPGERSVFGDRWTAEGIRSAMEVFATKGYGLDVEHDENDVTGNGMVVVESFLAREGDPTFVEGAWVVAIKFTDEALWQQVLAGELNGLSYQATVYQESDPEQIAPSNTVVVGDTLPDIVDGHIHSFTVIVDQDGRVVAGGTDEVNGHSHTISSHSVTDSADGHTHRVSLPDYENEVD